MESVPERMAKRRQTYGDVMGDRVLFMGMLFGVFVCGLLTGVVVESTPGPPTIAYAGLGTLCSIMLLCCTLFWKLLQHSRK